MFGFRDGWKGWRCLLVALLLSGPAMAEFTPAECVIAVEGMRHRAASLPSHDLSRRFAETALHTALMEMEAGDPDECEEMVAHAAEIIETRPYVLKPGEALNGYGPDAPALIAPAAAMVSDQGKRPVE